MRGVDGRYSSIEDREAVLRGKHCNNKRRAPIHSATQCGVPFIADSRVTARGRGRCNHPPRDRFALLLLSIFRSDGSRWTAKAAPLLPFRVGKALVGVRSITQSCAAAGRLPPTRLRPLGAIGGDALV